MATNPILEKYSRIPKQIILGDFKIARPISGERIEYPFEGDTFNFTLSQQYMCFLDYYPENVLPVGYPHPQYPGCVLTKTTPPEEQKGALCTFTMEWAKLPGFYSDEVIGKPSIRKEFESFVWTRPGRFTTGLDYIWYYIDQTKTVIDATSAKLYTYNGDKHNIDPKWNTATVYYYVEGDTGAYSDRFYTSTILNRGDDWIQVNKVPYGGTNPIVYYQFAKPIVQIQPQQLVVNSVVYFDYWMVGYNINKEEDIPIIQQWEILDENLNPTTILTEQTHPPMFDNATETGYDTMVAQKQWLVAEASTTQRWLGSIYERKTRYVLAI